MPTKTPFLFEDWMKLAGWNFLFGLGVTILFLIGYQLLYHRGTDGRAVITMLAFFIGVFVLIQLVNLLYLLLKKMNTHVVPVFQVVITCMFYFGHWNEFCFLIALVAVNHASIIFLLKK